jgi:hypothetical protein
MHTDETQIQFQLDCKFGLDARPHLCLLPRGEDLTNHVFHCSIDRIANPAAGISTDAAKVSPSPWGDGRGEGGCESPHKTSKPGTDPLTAVAGRRMTIARSFNCGFDGMKIRKPRRGVR